MLILRACIAKKDWFTEFGEKDAMPLRIGAGAMPRVTLAKAPRANIAQGFDVSRRDTALLRSNYAHVTPATRRVRLDTVIALHTPWHLPLKTPMYVLVTCMANYIRKRGKLSCWSVL